MTSTNNRYQTPFEDIIPIRFAERCQKARVFGLMYGARFLVVIDEPTAVLPDATRQCQGKRKYPTYVAAANMIERRHDVLARFGKERELYGMHPYHCVCCSMWHIGHRPGTRRKQLYKHGGI